MNNEFHKFHEYSRSKEGLYFKEESYAIIGACFEVYNELGAGFLENVYQESLMFEFSLRNIPFLEKPRLRINYKGHLLEKTYEADFLCFDCIVVELKAQNNLIDGNRAQVINYLRCSEKKLGLLVNFGNSSCLERERLVN